MVKNQIQGGKISVLRGDQALKHYRHNESHDSTQEMSVTFISRIL